MSAELRPFLLRDGDANPGADAVDQCRAGKTLDRARQGGKNPAKAGRAKIVEVARKFGIITPLPDTPSLPIGADEVNVLEHAVAYATFPNKGKAVAPHAVLEVRTGAGDLVWRYDRDGPAPRQIIPPSVAADMAGMMSYVVSEGTARRAILDGIPAAGKTGTTNAYRDAWFVGYTGNFVCGVWYGNDDYSPTNRLTGGALPAQTWHDIMTAAHRGIEVKDLPGVAAPAKPTADVAAKTAASDDNAKPAPPPILTKRGADILVRVEKMLDQAAKTIGKTSAGEPVDPARSGALSPTSSGGGAENLAAATSSDRAAPAPSKN